MDLLLEQTKHGTVLKIAGTVTLSEIEHFDAVLTSLVTPDITRLCIDCSALEAWDDAAIANVINLCREYERGNNRVVMCGLSPKLKGDLDRRGMLEFLPIRGSLEEAVVYLSEGDDDADADSGTDSAPASQPSSSS